VHSQMEAMTLPGTIESLSRIREYVRQAAAAAGVERKQAYRLALAVDEIATNVVNHGYGEAGLQGDLVVSAASNGADFTITLEDSAAPFDPRSVPRPSQLDLPLDKRPIGGLGVFLALESVDLFKYEYAHKRNRNKFTVRRGSG
jgi:serine/threonine-protein kinase RsbW